MYNYYETGNNQMSASLDLSGLNGRRIRVRFDGLEESSTKKYFPVLSTDLAAPGTFTDDFEWRQELKVNDFIDCCD
jgi:hypothetical protein